MSDETATTEAQDQESPNKKRRRRPTIVYLYGASADRRNRAARRSRTGRQPRQVRLGLHKKTIVRRNRRVPVTLQWVEENREELKAKIAEGVIWVEDSSRKRAPDRWLKEMGLWTDPKSLVRNYPTTNKAAYNDNVSEDADEGEDDGRLDFDEGEDVDLDDLTEDLENTPDDEDETEGLEDSEEDDDQDEEGDEPEGEDPEDDPSDDEPDEPDEPEGILEAMAGSEDVTIPNTKTGKPLPEDWRDSIKKDLLALMEDPDRKIPLPTDPESGKEDVRNDSLITAIGEWAAERGLE